MEYFIELESQLIGLICSCILNGYSEWAFMDNNLIDWSLWRYTESNDQIWKFPGIGNLNKHNVHNVDYRGKKTKR